ncbi:hypothetical protein D3C81_1128670 [compost metagenome]
MLYTHSIDIKPDRIRINQRRSRMLHRVIPCIFTIDFNYRLIRMNGCTLRRREILQNRRLHIISIRTIQGTDLIYINDTGILFGCRSLHIPCRHIHCKWKCSSFRNIRLEILPSYPVYTNGLIGKVQRNRTFAIAQLRAQPVSLAIPVHPHADFLRISGNLDIVSSALGLQICARCTRLPGKIVFQLQRTTAKPDQILIRLNTDLCCIKLCARRWSVSIQSVFEILKHNRRQTDIHIYGCLNAFVADNNFSALLRLIGRRKYTVSVDRTDWSFNTPLKLAVIRLDDLTIPERFYVQCFYFSRRKALDLIAKGKLCQRVHNLNLRLSV